jgi:predicted ester cyclase
MITRTPEEAARGVFAALHAHDLDAVRGFLADDDQQEFVPVGAFSGADSVVEFFGELLAAFPDLEFHVEDLVADDRAAAVRWRLVGTFSGTPFQGLQPCWRRIELQGADALIIVRDGRIQANTIFYDGAAFARAIGLLPARGSFVERILYALYNARMRLMRVFRRQR